MSTGNQSDEVCGERMQMPVRTRKGLYFVSVDIVSGMKKDEAVGQLHAAAQSLVAEHAKG